MKFSYISLCMFVCMYAFEAHTASKCRGLKNFPHDFVVPASGGRMGLDRIFSCCMQMCPICREAWRFFLSYCAYACEGVVGGAYEHLLKVGFMRSRSCRYTVAWILEGPNPIIPRLLFLFAFSSLNLQREYFAAILRLQK